jgi:hypothetical protein
MTNLPLYQIADWDRLFENNRSRHVDSCTFVCFRNDDGPAATVIENHCDSASIFGVWHRLGKLCSRQGKPRHGYVTSDGTRNGWRLGSEQLGHMWRLPASTVRRAFAVLSSRQVGWINLIEGAPEVTSLQATSENGSLDDMPPALVVTSENVTHSAAENVSGSEIDDVNERKKEGMKEPPVVPQGGTETDLHNESLIDQNFEKLKNWVNSLFGRQRAWNYEEMNLLTELVPISREDRALLSWAYTLPRDVEGWAIVDGEQLSKPKHSALLLLREFSSEIDKWKSVRVNLNGSEEHEPEGDGWTPERVKVCQEDFPDTTWPPRFDSVPIDVQRQIDRRARDLVNHE